MTLPSRIGGGKVGPVREPFRLPFIFLLVLACVGALFTVLQLAAAWGVEASSAGGFTLAWALGRLPRAAFEVMTPAVILSIVLLGFRMVRRPFSRLAGFLIVLVAGYLALVNGLLWTHRAGSADPAAPAGYLQPAVFTGAGSYYLYPQAVNGGRLGPVLLARMPGSAPRLSLSPGGTAAAAGAGTTVRLEGSTPMEIRGGLTSAAAALFRPDNLTGGLLSDVATCTADLERQLTASLPRLFAACFALVFLVSASLVFLRLTRWPLANVLLLALAVRGYFWLYHWLAVQGMAVIARVAADPAVAGLVPAAAMVALGVLLLLVDILFVPADRWSAEAPG